MTELKEELSETKSGLLTIWLTEAGTDQKARKELEQLFLGSDVQFRNLRRVIRTLFDDSIKQTYEDKKDSDFNLGYRKALRDIWKLIPQTRSE